MPDQPSAAELLRAYLRAFERVDLPAILAVFTDDASLSMPYAPAPLKQSYCGKEQLEQVFGMVTSLAATIRFLDVELFGTEDVAFATARSEMTFRNGRPYTNQYAWLLKARDGRAFHLSEFYDGQRVAAVFAPLV
jgi:ketosteroid isomerase-like protein